MIHLIFNADDLGYSPAVNYGIIDSHVNGVVNSATMMTNMPGFKHAVKLAKEHPTLGVGVHLVLTCGSPIRKDVSSLVDEKGNFFKTYDSLKAKGFSTEEVEKEWETQIQTFFNAGLTPTHLDSHHHVHSQPELHDVILRLSKKHNLSVRLAPFGKIEGIQPFSDVIYAGFYKQQATVAYLDTIVSEAKDGQTIEIMTHPAYLDSIILEGSSYNMDRVKEYEVLTNWKLPKGFQLVQF